jgi:5-methylcytosine-specific restriction endonuclease McrA
MKRKYNATATGKYWNMRSRARKNKPVFDIKQIDFENWFNTTPKWCFYCKRDLEFGTGRGNSWGFLTVDRFDNGLGYTIDNIVLACKACNTIKGFWFSGDEMVEIAEKYKLGER